MVVRIQKKMTPQTTTLLLSTTKPTHHKGDFSTLEPVNPNRQRITVFDGQGAFKDPSDKTNKISSYPADSIFQVEPYPNITIYGDPEKLINPKCSSRRDSIEITDGRAKADFSRPNPIFTSSYGFEKGKNVSGLSSPINSTDARLPYGVASTISQTDKQIFSNQNFTDLAQSREFSLRDYKPPPSAPAG